MSFSNANKESRFFLFIISLLFLACAKQVQIAPPTSTITTGEVFSDSADANAAVAGIYSNLINTSTGLLISDGALSIYTGGSADELIPFSGSLIDNQIYTNSITSTNDDIYSYYWIPAYQVIYQTNACIAGLEASTGVSQNNKSELIAEAKFIRAFLHFYLINLFGDVPYITSIQYAQTSLATRTPVAQIYQSLISDLIQAQDSLQVDYSFGNGMRVRANQAAATALLARVYLYTKDWKDAITQSTAVINNGYYSLAVSPDSVFLFGSPEAILQWNLNANIFPFNATAEGYQIIPATSVPPNPPNYYLSPELLAAFEPGDLRKSEWIDSTDYSGAEYYFPYKYRVGPSQYQAGGAVSELYTVLRLAEQYLIRAEAEAELGDLMDALNDINKVRARANLGPLNSSLSQAQVLAAVFQERRVELFAEWGHRWLDLKRTGQVDSVMTAATPLKIGGGPWMTYQQLYPIPYSELSLDPNLTQNPGYN